MRLSNTSALSVALSFLIVIGVLYSFAPSCFSQEKEKVVPEKILFTAYEAFGTRFQSPMGVFYDSNHDEILVADTGNHRVVILDGTDGSEKTAFTHLVRNNKSDKATPGEPRSIAVNSLGDTFIADNLCNYVEVCDFRGTHLSDINLEEYIQLPVESSTSDLKPLALAVDSKDNLYVTTSSSIYVFNKELEFLKQIGHKGTGPDGFSAITGLWVDADRKIYVTDAQGLGLRVFSPEGNIMLAFGEHEAGFNNFSMPVGVISDRKGYIWVADSLRHIVSIFSAEGKFLDYIGAYGYDAGYFAYPSGIAYNNDRKIVVLERVNSRLQCFELPSFGVEVVKSNQKVK